MRETRNKKELSKKIVSWKVRVVLEERRPVFEHPYLSVIGCGLLVGGEKWLQVKAAPIC